MAWPLFHAFVSTQYLARLIAWISLILHVFRVFHDVVHDHDLKGTVKAPWVLLIFVLPLRGCLLYLRSLSAVTCTFDKIA